MTPACAGPTGGSQSGSVISGDDPRVRGADRGLRENWSRMTG